MTVKTKDLGIGRLKKQLADLGKTRVLLGVMGSEAAATHPNSEASVGTIAKWMHFGVKHDLSTGLGNDEDPNKFKIQPRPWVDQAINNISEEAGPFLAKAASDLIDGRAKSIPEALERVGKMGTKAMLDAIDTSRDWAHPNAKKTIQRKGHDQPLVGLSSTLKNSQSYAIEVRGKVVARGDEDGER